MRPIRTPPRLAPRAADCHKASVGRVLVVGGSRDLSGAPALAGRGALRAGAGLVRIAVPRSVQALVAGHLAEATTAGLPETRTGGLALAAKAPVVGMLDAWDAVVLGPGLGRASPSLQLARELAQAVSRPLVLDADALFALVDHVAPVKKRKAATVLTPHEGEAARLLGTTSAKVRADREGAAQRLVEKTGTVVVLKGPGTLVADEGRLYTNRTGGPLLASGGTGDVLAGVIGALLAGLPDTGGDAFGAACAAVHVHGVAADELAGKHDRGVLASEIADQLPVALASLVTTSAARAEDVP